MLELVGLINADLLLPELSPPSPGLIGSVPVNRVLLPVIFKLNLIFRNAPFFRSPLKC